MPRSTACTLCAGIEWASLIGFWPGEPQRCHRGWSVSQHKVIDTEQLGHSAMVTRCAMHICPDPLYQQPHRHDVTESRRSSMHLRCWRPAQLQCICVDSKPMIQHVQTMHSIRLTCTQYTLSSDVAAAAAWPPAATFGHCWQSAHTCEGRCISAHSTAGSKGDITNDCKSDKTQSLHVA